MTSSCHRCLYFPSRAIGYPLALKNAGRLGLKVFNASNLFCRLPVAVFQEKSMGLGGLRTLVVAYFYNSKIKLSLLGSSVVYLSESGGGVRGESACKNDALSVTKVPQDKIFNCN